MVLVTGGTGFIGSHTLEKLCALGEATRALVRRKTALPPGVEPVFGDLTTSDGLDHALDGADAVIHIAGVTKALSAGDYYNGNALATGNLARAAAGRRVRLVHVSSLAAIGPSPDGAPLSEDAEPHPVSHYGRSKLDAERALRKWAPDAVVVRPPVVYGPRDTGVFSLFRAISNGLALEIGGAERWFSSIYVGDLVDALISAVKAPHAAGRDYFAAHSQPTSWRMFRSAAARIMARSPRVLRVPVPIARAAGGCAELWSRITRTPGIISRDKVAEARCRYWVCDTRRAAAELGFQAATSLESGLARTLAWYKEAGWLEY